MRSSEVPLPSTTTISGGKKLFLIKVSGNYPKGIQPMITYIEENLDENNKSQWHLNYNPLPIPSSAWAILYW